MNLIYFTTYFSLFVGFGITLVGSRKILQFFEESFLSKSFPNYKKLIEEVGEQIAGSLRTIQTTRIIAEEEPIGSVASLMSELDKVEEQQSKISGRIGKLSTILDKIGNVKTNFFRLSCFISAMYSLIIILLAAIIQSTDISLIDLKVLHYVLIRATWLFLGVTSLIFILDFLPRDTFIRDLIGTLFMGYILYVIVKSVFIYNTMIAGPEQNVTDLRNFSAGLIYFHLVLFPIFNYLLYFIKSQLFTSIRVAYLYLRVKILHFKIKKKKTTISAFFQATQAGRTLTPGS